MFLKLLIYCGWSNFIFRVFNATWNLSCFSFGSHCQQQEATQSYMVTAEWHDVANPNTGVFCDELIRMCPTWNLWFCSQYAWFLLFFLRKGVTCLISVIYIYAQTSFKTFMVLKSEMSKTEWLYHFHFITNGLIWRWLK